MRRAVKLVLFGTGGALAAAAAASQLLRHRSEEPAYGPLRRNEIHLPVATPS